ERRVVVEERQQVDDAAVALPVAAGRQDELAGVVVVGGDAELVQVVLALRVGRGLADLLDCRQQQADQDGDDGNHHQQLDQREGRTAERTCHDTSPKRNRTTTYETETS